MKQKPISLCSVFVFTIIAIFSNYNCAKGPYHYLSKQSRVIHQTYWESESHIAGHMMEGTQYKTPLFRFEGASDGPTVLIVGGTHGNEPAGFEAAHRLIAQFAGTPPQKGVVFIIPEANKISILNNNRRIPVPEGVDRERGNLNRCYPGDANGLPMEKMASEVTELIRSENVKLLLDLHESPVFHLEYKSKKKEYHGLGQTLIYTPNEEATWLGMVTLDHLNSQIPPGLKQFSLAERPIKYSTAWVAGEYFNIPGFTVETCKKLPLKERIHYQLEVVNRILQEFGVID